MNLQKMTRAFALLFLISLISACSTVDKLKNSSIFGDESTIQKIEKPIKRKPIKTVETPVIPTRTEPYKVAIILPTKSANPNIKNVAMDLLAAAYLAKKELNEDKLSMLVYQTDGTEKSVINMTQDIIGKKTDLILGPLLASSVTTMRPMTEKAQIPMIAFSSDNQTVKGGYSYLLSYLMDQNINTVTNYAISKGNVNYGIYASQTNYGTRAANIFTQEVEKRGGKITNSYIFNTQSPDFHIKSKEFTSIEEIRAGTTEKPTYTSIMFPDDPKTMAYIMPILNRYGLDSKNMLFLGTGIWHDESILKVKELNNAIFAAPDNQKLSIFESRFSKKYGKRPVQIASLAYDGVGLAVGLIRKHSEDPFNYKNIVDPNGFMGVGGVFRFKSNGLSERGLNIVRINNGKFDIIQPAPTTFIGQ